MTEHTWILDPATGVLSVQGLKEQKASALAGGLFDHLRLVSHPLLTTAGQVEAGQARERRLSRAIDGGE